MILPVIEMPVYESVSAYRVEPISEIDIDISLQVDFAVRILDQGLTGMNIEEGDILLFTQTSWPNDHEQIVLACYENEEYYLRILEQFDPFGPIRLKGSRDVPIIKTDKHSVIVKGTCSHVLKSKYNKIYYVDTWDGKLYEPTHKSLSYRGGRK